MKQTVTIRLPLRQLKITQLLEEPCFGPVAFSSALRDATVAEEVVLSVRGMAANVKRQK